MAKNTNRGNAQVALAARETHRGVGGTSRSSPKRKPCVSKELKGLRAREPQRPNVVAFPHPAENHAVGGEE